MGFSVFESSQLRIQNWIDSQHRKIFESLVFSRMWRCTANVLCSPRILYLWSM